MKTRIKKTYWCHLLAIGYLFIFFLTSCEKEITPYAPGEGQEAYVNFYSAVEVVAQRQTEPLHENNMIYIQDSVKSELFPYVFPTFTNTTSDGRQFPEIAGSDITPTWTGNNDQIRSNVFWQPLPMNDFYRFIFTSTNKVFLKDITLSLAPKSFTMLYLTESPESDNAYTIVAVPAGELKGVEKKVKVQVVNLATDWGSIDIVLTDRNGDIVDTNLPENLAFGKYSTYALLDPQYANGYKKLALRIRKHGEENFTLSTNIDAVPGSSYIVVVKGFAKEATRYIKKSNTEQARIEITPSLRVHNRRLY